MSETTNTPAADKPQKHRSPSYPAIDLKTAIGRLREIQKVAGTHPAPMATVIKTWGYGAKSSNGILTVAALKKYGLTTDSGRADTRKIHATLLGQEILFYGEETGEWLERVRKAALTPSIYKELWKKYGRDGLPDDSVMLHELIFERGFSDSAAREVLRLFRSTVTYARLTDADAMVSPDEDGGGSGDEGDENGVEGEFVTVATPESSSSPSPPAASGAAPPPIQIRVRGRTVVLRESEALTGADWDSMIEILKMLRPEE